LTHGKRRTHAQESPLRVLIEGEKLDAIAEALNHQPSAVSMRLSRTGLKVVVEKKNAKSGQQQVQFCPKIFSVISEK
jgi:hypothetical protein